MYNPHTLIAQILPPSVSDSGEKRFNSTLTNNNVPQKLPANLLLCEGELLMSFQDVAFLPSRARFSTICLKTVVGGKQGNAPCKILLLQQSLFCVS